MGLRKESLDFSFSRAVCFVFVSLFLPPSRVPSHLASPPSALLLLSMSFPVLLFFIPPSPPLTHPPPPPNVSIPPPYSLPRSPCNQSCDWAVFTGSSQGPAGVTHSLYNNSPLSSPSIPLAPLLWSDYSGSNRKTFLPSLPALLIHPHTSTLNLSHLLLRFPQLRQTSRRPRLISPLKWSPLHSGGRLTCMAESASVFRPSDWNTIV